MNINKLLLAIPLSVIIEINKGRKSYRVNYAIFLETVDRKCP